MSLSAASSPRLPKFCGDRRACMLQETKEFCKSQNWTDWAFSSKYIDQLIESFPKCCWTKALRVTFRLRKFLPNFPFCLLAPLPTSLQSCTHISIFPVPVSDIFIHSKAQKGVKGSPCSRGVPMHLGLLWASPLSPIQLHKQNSCWFYHGPLLVRQWLVTHSSSPHILLGR